MAALNFSNIFRCLAAKNCPVGRCGTLVSTIIAERQLSSTHTRTLNQRSKYGRTEVKSAGIVPADRRQACSHAAIKVAGSRSSGVDHDGSGSSGRENREVRRIDLRLPWTKRMPKVAFLVTNLFSPEKCQRLIDITEQIGYQPTDEVDSKNSRTCLWQSKEEAEQLLNVMRPFIPENWWEGTRLCGLHNVLQFERHRKGSSSPPLRGGIHVQPNGDRSYLTFQLFLNDVKDGGFTSLVSPPVCAAIGNRDSNQEANPLQRIDIQSNTGSVLIYQNDIFHENTPVISGVKYTLKGEVLYTMSPVTSFFDGDTRSVRSFFSGRPTSPAETPEVIQPTTWFFSSRVPTDETKTSSKPKGIPFYVPQKKRFIYV